ncbi:MAG: hypothetical protein RMM29_03705 [Planctomycetota bacterium]|nr:hypothetical protein [Planctomycetota bacterium]MCX8039009.1 hypothetical protein [Planctomycetota bacterium]MDW8372740.1 hypothetical protein [Planctomycetota bacterium]
MPRWALLIAVLAVLGCQRAAPPAAPQFGSIGAFAASILLQTRAPDGEGEVFTVRLWRAAQGDARLRVQKLDVDLIDGLLRRDGSFIAWSPRERVATSGGADAAPPLLADVRWLLRELAEGPEETGVADRDAEGRPLARVIGERRIVYARWQDYDGRWRPSLIRIVERDGRQIAMRLKALDIVPAISAERLRLSVPEDAAVVAPAAFLERIAGSESSVR